MAAARTAVTVLRVASILTIIVGLIGVAGGIASSTMIHVLGALIPAWAPGAMVTGFGVYYYARLKELEKKARLNS